jgi:hypothetical protein
MADRRSLCMIGYIFSGVAAIVIGVAFFVVQAQLNGYHMIEDPRAGVPALQH